MVNVKVEPAPPEQGFTEVGKLGCWGTIITQYLCLKSLETLSFDINACADFMG